MIYLTQATLALDFAAAARVPLRDNYDWHRAVWQAFPGRDGARRDFLTRLDANSEGFRLWIVSPVEPVRPEWWEQVPDCWRTRPIPDAYFRRGRYAFQLCANPTKKVAKLDSDGGRAKNGRRIPLSTREDLTAWIARKGTAGGFSVDEDSLQTSARGRAYFKKNGRSGLHSAVEFRGLLTVNNPKIFQETFMRGVGSAKAFGFGLLVIQPVS